MNWLINRFKEPSTWRGLITLASILGYSFSPEQGEKIVTAAVALIGLIEVFRKEPPKAKELPNDNPQQSITTPELTEEQRQALNNQ